MSDEGYTFEQTRARLDEILTQVRKKDVSLEQSLELLEEGVRLANRANELIDQTSWNAAEGEGDTTGGEPAPDGAAAGALATHAAEGTPGGGGATAGTAIGARSDDREGGEVAARTPGHPGKRRKKGRSGREPSRPKGDERS